MPTVPINGIELYYETLGEGPPLLLVAGLASDSQSWATVTADLAKGRRAILVDNRGVGRTRPWGAEVSIPVMAEDCAPTWVASLPRPWSWSGART